MEKVKRVSGIRIEFSISFCKEFVNYIIYVNEGTKFHLNIAFFKIVFSL